jgi:hypothetical protein
MTERKAKMAKCSAIVKMADKIAKMTKYCRKMADLSTLQKNG